MDREILNILEFHKLHQFLIVQYLHAILSKLLGERVLYTGAWSQKLSQDIIGIKLLLRWEKGNKVYVPCKNIPFQRFLIISAKLSAANEYYHFNALVFTSIVRLNFMLNVHNNIAIKKTEWRVLT